MGLFDASRKKEKILTIAYLSSDDMQALYHLDKFDVFEKEWYKEYVKNK